MTDDILAWLNSFECSRKWLNGIQSPNTQEAYIRVLKQYCDAVDKNPDELIAFKIEGLRNIATEKEFQAEDLLDNYLYNSGLTDHVKILVLCGVKSFYKANRRALEANVGKNISKPESKQRTPKIQDILDLDNVMTFQRDKAILWFLESAPFRQGTMTKLVWGYLKPTSELLKQIRQESRGQVNRTIEEDAQLATDVPFYVIVEAERMKGGGKRAR